ncbi:hypothetical protein P7M41_26440, partial [Vibrio parahaemolyticus]|nr:hypothetical protein [Vibrio parahaemolyticus]
MTRTKTLSTAKTRPQTSGLKHLGYYDRQHNNLTLQEIHPTKGEPSTATQRSAVALHRLELDFNRGQLQTQRKDEGC